MSAEVGRPSPRAAAARVQKFLDHWDAFALLHPGAIRGGGKVVASFPYSDAILLRADLQVLLMDDSAVSA